MARSGTTPALLRARVIERLQASAEVLALVPSAANIQSTRTIEIADHQLPIVAVYVFEERGEINGWSCLAPNFAGECDITIEFHVKGATDAALATATDGIDAVLDAVMTDETLQRLMDRWVRFDRSTGLVDEAVSKRHAMARVICTCAYQSGFVVSP